MNRKYLSRLLAVLLVTALVMSAAACGASGGDTTGPISYSLTLDQSSVTLSEDAQATLTATVQPEGQVSWSSSDESVVSVSNGTLLAKKAGSATVTAAIGDTEAACQVTVTAADGSFLYLEPSQTFYPVEIGGAPQTVAFTLYQVAADGSRTEITGEDITYTLENEKLAALEGDQLTGTVGGVTAVTATSGNYSAAAEVRIYDKFISTPEEWCQMLASRTLGEYYMLDADIDFAGKTYTGANTGAPASVKSRSFRANLDGNGHAVKNVRLSGSGNVSLFGQLYSAEIRNIAFQNVEVTAGNSSGLATSISGQNTVVENVSLELHFASGKGNVLFNTCYGGTVRNLLVTVTAPGELTGIRNVRSVQLSGVYVLAQGGLTPCEGMSAYTSKMELVADINNQRLLSAVYWQYTGGPELPVLING